MRPVTIGETIVNPKSVTLLLNYTRLEDELVQTNQSSSGQGGSRNLGPEFGLFGNVGFPGSGRKCLLIKAMQWVLLYKAEVSFLLW